MIWSRFNEKVTAKIKWPKKLPRPGTGHCSLFPVVDSKRHFLPCSWVSLLPKPQCRPNWHIIFCFFNGTQSLVTLQSLEGYIQHSTIRSSYHPLSKDTQTFTTSILFSIVTVTACTFDLESKGAPNIGIAKLDQGKS